MKRRRGSVDCEINKRKEVDELSHILCSFIENVPETILLEIFLRLSVKEIIMCKSVCKIWYHLIRMPQFAKLHFDHAQPCVVVKGSRPVNPSQVCRFLYLIEPHKVNVTPCHCDKSFGLCEHRVSLKLDTIMKIPLRNIELLPEANGDSKTKSSGAIRKRVTKVKATQHKFCIVNSCNGFLCLSDPQSNNPMTVCNPVTGEYLNLPGTEKGDAKMENIVCGFGYSLKSNKYKVIRMFEPGELQDDSYMFNDRERYSRTVAETYTFGKGSWKRIGNVPFSRHIKTSVDRFPVYCNGAVNWLQYNNLDRTAFICSFDLDKDSFKSIELPLACGRSECGERLGVVGGCLCFLSFSKLCKSFTLWVMNKDGSPSSWTNMITIHDDYCHRRPMPVISYLPISYSKDAGLIMSTSRNSVFAHLNQTHDWKYLQIVGVDLHYQAYVYVPTFLSLKDALTDEDEILNVNTMDIKLPGESMPLFLKEQNWNFETKSSDQSDEDYI